MPAGKLKYINAHLTGLLLCLSFSIIQLSGQNCATGNLSDCGDIPSPSLIPTGNSSFCLGANSSFQVSFSDPAFVPDQICVEVTVPADPSILPVQYSVNNSATFTFNHTFQFNPTNSCTGSQTVNFFLTAYAIVNCPGGQSVSSIILPVSARKLPNANFSLLEDSVCTFEDITITDLFCPNASSAQYTWNWGDGSPVEVYATETLPQHQFPGSGIYTITHQIQQLGAQACGSHTVSRTVSVFPHARVNILGPDTVCSGQQFLPLATALDVDSLVYSFSPASGSFISNPEVLNPNMVLNSAVEASYNLNLQGYGCCNGDSAICDQTYTIQVLPAPSASPLNNAQFCLPPAGGVQLNPLSLFNIINPQGIITGAQWTFIGGTPATATGLNPGLITYNSTGDYSIQLNLFTAGNACDASSAVSFSVVSTPPQPLIEFSEAPFCQGDSVFILITNPVAQINYVWTGPDSFSFSGISDTLLNAQLTQAGDYTVTAGPAGCSSTSTATLSIDQGPALQIEPVSPLCEGDTLELIVSGGTFYNWSASPFISSQSGDTVQVWPPSTSSFTVQSQSASGCPGQTSVNVTVLNLPIVTLVVPSPVCSGSGNQQLTGLPQQGTQAGDAGVYGGPGVNTVGSFPTDATGSFEAFYVYTSPSGCFDTAFATIDIIDPPVANAGADITGLCINQPAFMLNGSGSAPGNWQVIGSLLQSNGMFNPAQEGVFEAIYEIGAGSCYASDTASITVNGLPTINLINNDFELCANEGNVQLTSLPGTGVIWSGPGVDSWGLFNPTVAGQGQHIILVSITDANLCENSDSVSINVLGFPDASFSISDVFACEQQQISFIPAVAGLDTYNWSFGDGSFSVQDTSFHSYNPGNYQVTLEVISGICRDTVTQSLQVQQFQQPVLSIADNTLCPNQELVFENNSSGVYQQLSWLVNSVQISTSASGGNFLPTPSECADSVYTLTLQLTDSTCGILSTEGTFTVYAPPQAIVAMNPVVTEICPSTPVTFINNGCNPSVNLSWDFGFGPTAVGNNPAPVFFPDSTDEVDWPVVLTAQDIYNCGITRDTLLVTVNPNNINININLNSASICLGDTVYIDNNSSSYTGISCLWQFGDNTQSTACQPEYHLYSQPGTYVMKLNQSNVCYSSEDSVMVEVQGIPSVTFNYDSGPHCVGEPIGFNAESNPPGLLVSWDFGDSGSPAGNQVNYSFDSAGVFVVSAQVQDGPDCPAIASQQIFIDYLPSSEIEAEVLNLCPGEPIQLSAGDNSGNAVFTWNFGDNSAENGAQISHAFNNPNEQITAYTIVLTASNLQGTCFSSDSVQVQVYPSTNAAFDLPESLYCQHGADPLQIIPQNLAQNATSYVWWLNNVEFSEAFEPVIEISSPGSYELKMRSENIFTCPDSALVIFEVQPAPVANFNLNSTVFCEGETLILQDQSQGVIVNWIWDSGNFIQDGSAVDSTILGLAGTFSVSLVVQDQNGCRDTLQQINAYTVYPTPEAGFTVSPAEIEVLNPGYSVSSFAQFNDFCRYEISDQDGVIDSCDFSSILEDPFQEFLTIVQTVTNVAGCEDKMIQNIRILPDFVLTAPSVFTPNGDGHNDVFKPILVNVSEEGFELLIFDRRGNIVFQTSSISDAWDGTLLGSDWNQADRMEYEIYTVKMKGRSMFDGRKREYDGKLKLVREGK